MWSPETIWNMAALIVSILAIGGIIGGVIVWWCGMKRHLTDGPKLVTGLQTAAANEQTRLVGHVVWKG